MSSATKELAKDKSQGGKLLLTDELRKMNAYWRACNYLCVPRLQLTGAHTKERLKKQIIEAVNYAHGNGIDNKEFREWKWPLE